MLRSLPSSALRPLLKPLVKLFVRHSRSFQEFAALSKELFIEVAEEEIKKSSDRVNTSRVSVMTGLHRDEVSRLRRTVLTAEDLVNIPARVIGQWEQDRRFHDRAGRPKNLAFQGKESEFWKLVRTVNTHVNPAALLFELERNKIVERIGDRVKLISTIAFATPNFENGLRILARDIDTLIAAVTENLSQGKSVNLHINTHYDNIYLSDLPRIRQWLMQRGKALHSETREYLSESDGDLSATSSRGEAGAKVVLSTFSFVVASEEN